MEFSDFFKAQPTEVRTAESTFHVITGSVLLLQDETTTAWTRFCILTRWITLLQIVAQFQQYNCVFIYSIKLRTSFEAHS